MRTPIPMNAITSPVPNRISQGVHEGALDATGRLLHRRGRWQRSARSGARCLARLKRKLKPRGLLLEWREVRERDFRATRRGVHALCGANLDFCADALKCVCDRIRMRPRYAALHATRRGLAEITRGVLIDAEDAHELWDGICIPREALNPNIEGLHRL